MKHPCDPHASPSAVVPTARTRRFDRAWHSSWLAAGLLAAASHAQATTIMGGSDLLDATSAQQLTEWLGHGSLRLTNLFDKSAGQTSTDFHSAVDGKGATFSVIEVTGFGGVPFDAPVLIGGYNPQSWSSIDAYTDTPGSAERTAFVFNLTESLLFRQSLGGTGVHQTYNVGDHGPVFGSGHDLSVEHQLNRAYSRLDSYAATSSDYHKDIARYPSDYAFVSADGYDLQLGRIEVFAIASEVAPPIPEPSTYALMLAGLGLVGGLAARRAGRR